MEPALHAPWNRYGCRLRTLRSQAMAPVVASQCGRKTDWHSATSSTAGHVDRPAPAEHPLITDNVSYNRQKN